MQHVLDEIKTYLRRHAHAIFEPIFTYLEDEGAMRSMSELNHYFAKHYSLDGVDMPCEWLAQEGYLHKMGVPVRITSHSHINVEEVAYAYREGETP